MCHARGLGLSHREIAAAAQVSHGTVRAILTRATTTMHHGHAAEPQSPEREAGELAA
jgi:DNA-directed RNA polymerase specialized sigma24 family protein